MDESNKENLTVEFEKNNREIVKISFTEFRGKKLVDIRVWYQDKEDNEYKPSKKGVSLTIDKFKELKDAILQFDEKIESNE